MLPIMASSVSSKWAFSSAGIIISKHCNWLKVDIIKPLQFLKCIYHHNLLFHEEHSTELELDIVEYEELQPAIKGDGEKKG